MNNDLATMQSSTMDLIPDAGTWATISAMAEALIPTGFLPEGIKTPAQAVAIILKGRELRIPPMYALSNIHVIKGKPTVSAEVMLALVQRDHGMNAMWVEESTNEFCKVGYKSGNGTKFYTFHVNDAKLAGLTKSPTWAQYPAAMCRARAISATARMAFPGTIAGMYVPGELGDPVEVNEDGAVVSTGDYTEAPRMTATVEVIDEDGVIDDDPRTEAITQLSKLVSKYQLTNDEARAMLRNWGITSGRADDMTVEQLKAGVMFIGKKGPTIKKYAVDALANEQELDKINQLSIEEAQD